MHRKQEGTREPFRRSIPLRGAESTCRIAMAMEHVGSGGWHAQAAALVEEGRWQEAEGLFLKALESMAAAHPDRLHCTNGLAEVLHKRGRLQEAEALYRQMLEVEGVEPGGGGRQEEPAPEILRVFSGLADVLLDSGLFPKAEALHRRVLEARRAAFGEEHPVSAGV